MTFPAAEIIHLYISEIVPFEFVNEAKATVPDIDRWVREEIGENEHYNWRITKKSYLTSFEIR